MHGREDVRSRDDGREQYIFLGRRKFGARILRPPVRDATNLRCSVAGSALRRRRASVIVDLGIFIATVIATVIALRSVYDARQARDEASAHELTALDQHWQPRLPCGITNELQTLSKSRPRSLHRMLRIVRD